MPDNNDYRDLINERFKSLNEKIDTNNSSHHDMLIRIETQTIKTNGKVLKLEEKVNSLEISDASHGIKCPKAKDFEHLESSIASLKTDVDNKLQDLSFYIRNPKLALGIIVVAVIVTLFSYFSVEKYISAHEEEHTEQVEEIK